MVLTELTGIFEKLKCYLFVFVNIESNMEVKISKSYSSYKSQLKVFTFLNFPPNSPHQTTFEFQIFSDFFRTFQFLPCTIYGETKFLSYMGKGQLCSKPDWNLWTYMGDLWPCNVLWSFGVILVHLLFSENTIFKMNAVLLLHFGFVYCYLKTVYSYSFSKSIYKLFWEFKKVLKNLKYQ